MEDDFTMHYPPSLPASRPQQCPSSGGRFPSSAPHARARRPCAGRQSVRKSVRSQPGGGRQRPTEESIYQSPMQSMGNDTFDIECMTPLGIGQATIFSPLLRRERKERLIQIWSAMVSSLAGTKLSPSKLSKIMVKRIHLGTQLFWRVTWFLEVVNRPCTYHAAVARFALVEKAVDFSLSVRVDGPGGGGVRWDGRRSA